MQTIKRPNPSVVSRWFDIGCLILEDPGHSLRLEVFTQATPVALDHVQQVQITPTVILITWWPL